MGKNLFETDRLEGRNYSRVVIDYIKVKGPWFYNNTQYKYNQ